MQTQIYLILRRHKSNLSYADTKISYLIQTQNYLNLCRLKTILSYADIKISQQYVDSEISYLTQEKNISYLIHTQKYLILFTHKNVLSYAQTNISYANTKIATTVCKCMKISFSDKHPRKLTTFADEIKVTSPN